MTKSKSSSVTIRDVARAAGVSVATVSRYLNRHTNVSSEVSLRLEKVMAELEYVPHVSARKLATNKTNTIGLLLMDIGGDFFVPMLNGVERTARQNGYDLLISSTGDPKQPGGIIHMLGPHNTDGLLVFANSVQADRLKQLHEIGFPVVLIHSSPPEGLPIASVTVENKAASRKITEHLIEVHHRRRIVFLRGQEGQEDSYWRELGYRHALSLHDIPFEPSLVAMGEFNRFIAKEAILSMIASGIEFDGVFAGDDEAAIGVIASLQEAGIRVPEDVSVVGFDDQPIAQFITPRLTTVRAPTREVGCVATQTLVDLICNGRVEQLTLLPTEIVIRRSCGCQPAAAF